MKTPCKNGTLLLPAYYDSVLFLTPLKDAFVYNTNDDLLQVMMKLTCGKDGR